MPMEFQVAMRLLADDSIDLILTDPPWDDKFGTVATYTNLSEQAARVLKPGCSLVTYIGHNSIRNALEGLSTHLRYWWLCYVRLYGPARGLPGKWVEPVGRPLLWFVNGYRRDRNFVTDVVDVHSTAKKSGHPWAQHEEVAQHFIDRLTSPGETVYDPFAGSGTIPYVAAKSGRVWVASEIDEQYWAPITQRAQMGELECDTHVLPS